MPPMTYPERAHEGRLEVGGDGHKQGLAAGVEGQTRRHWPHHVVGRRTHAVLIRVQRKVLNKQIFMIYNSHVKVLKKPMLTNS